MKVGLVGYGLIGKAYGAILSAINWVQLCGIADPDQNIKNYLPSPTTHYYNNYIELIDSEHPEVLFICSPPRFHEEMARYAIDHNIHILCEKPIASDIEKIRELYYMSKEKNLHTTTGLQYILDPILVEAKQMLDEETFGKIYYVRAIMDEGGLHPNFDWTDYIYHQKNPDIASLNWKLDRSIGGGVIFESGCHMINIMRFLFGEYKKVSAMKIPFNSDREDIITHTSAHIGDIPLVSHTVGYVSRNIHCEFEIEIYGSKEECIIRPFEDIERFKKSSRERIIEGAGTILLKHAEKYQSLSLLKDNENLVSDLHRHEYLSTPRNRFLAQGLAENVWRFLDGIKQGVETIPSFYEALKTQEIGDAIYKSCIEGRSMDLLQ